MPVTVACVVVVMLAVRLSLSRQIKRWSSPYLLLAFFFFVGGIHGTLKNKPPEDPNHLRQLIEYRQEASVIGILIRSPEISAEKSSIIIDAKQLVFPEKNVRANGLAKISINGEIPLDIEPGDTIICRAWLSPVSTYGVPGAFNYKKFMAQKSIWITGWSKSPILIHKILPPSPPSFSEKIGFYPQKIRYRVNRFLDKTLSQTQAGVYKSILTGDRSGLSPSVREAFISSGATHLLAISGIHIGLLALISTTLFNLLLRRSEWIMLHFPVLKTSALLSLIPITAYAFIAGFGPPVVRSLVMAIVFIAAFTFNRQWSLANNIAIAALLLLIFSPSLLTTASFQLSFAAVSVISLFTPLLKKLAEKLGSKETSGKTVLWSKLKTWLLLSFIISVLASAGTAPIVLTHFNRLSLLSPIATVLVEPILCLWSLILGLIGTLFLPFPGLAAFLFKLGAAGIDASVTITTFMASLPFSSLWHPAPHPVQTVSWYLLLIGLSGICFQGFSRFKNIMLIAAMSGLLVPAIIPQGINDYLEVAVIDVGQGSAIVVHFPNGKTVLIDGGQKTSGKSNKFDIGRDVLAKYFWKKGITRLDTIIISHPDSDHYSGLSFILENFDSGKLVVNNLDRSKNNQTYDSYQQLLQKAQEHKIPVYVPALQDDLSPDDFAQLIVLSPAPTSSLPLTTAASNNDKSIVLQLSYGKTTFLFPSDVEKQGENTLLKVSPSQLKSQVLVSPHHGSSTSSSTTFLEAVMPEYVVVSAGKNSYGAFPSEENLSSYKKIGSKVYLTAESGTVFFKTDGQSLRVDTFF